MIKLFKKFFNPRVKKTNICIWQVNDGLTLFMPSCLDGTFYMPKSKDGGFNSICMNCKKDIFYKRS